ncbi:MAG: hypothetical protein LUD15_10620 [Bacteroides sp.]|nr:hypothetical protein [Bacteroides sp.]
MIRPDLVGDITSTRVTFESPYGKIFHEWERGENGYKSHITIPANTTAVICFPEAPRECITENGGPVGYNPSVTYLCTDGKYIMYKTGSGTYCFEVRKP